MSKLIAFIKLPLKAKEMSIQALFYAGMYRWKLLHRPFQSVAVDLGTSRHPDFKPKLSDPAFFRERISELAMISWIVNKVCDATPWKSECLVRAFTAKRILRQHNIPCLVYMGVMTDTQQHMLAHAWTKCGDYYITGEGGHELFTVTSCFYS